MYKCFSSKNKFFKELSIHLCLLAKIPYAALSFSGTQCDIKWHCHNKDYKHFLMYLITFLNHFIFHSPPFSRTTLSAMQYSKPDTLNQKTSKP